MGNMTITRLGIALVGLAMVGCAASSEESPASSLDADPASSSELASTGEVSAPPRVASGGEDASPSEALDLTESPPRSAPEGKGSAARLRVRRFGPNGPLPVRAVVWSERHEEAVAFLTGKAPDAVSLPAGRYHLLVAVKPGPFGFDVNIREGEPVDVTIQSKGRVHVVAIDTLQGLGPPLLFERQLLAFGWGEEPEPGAGFDGPESREAREPEIDEPARAVEFPQKQP